MSVIKYSEILAADEVLTAGDDDIIVLAVVDGAAPTGFTTKAIKKVNLLEAISNNIYTADDTIISDRTVTMGAFSLSFKESIGLGKIAFDKIANNPTVGLFDASGNQRIQLQSGGTSGSFILDGISFGITAPQIGAIIHTANGDVKMEGVTDTDLFFLDESINAIGVGSIPSSANKLLIKASASRAFEVQHTNGFKSFVVSNNNFALIQGFRHVDDSEYLRISDALTSWWNPTGATIGFNFGSTIGIVGLAAKISSIGAATTVALGLQSGNGISWSMFEDDNGLSAIGQKFADAATKFKINSINTNALVTEGGNVIFKGLTDANLFFLNKAADKVGFGTAVPTEIIDAIGSIKASVGFKAGAGIGQTGVFSFGGGGTGDIATMTFIGGILTGTTLVP